MSPEQSLGQLLDRRSDVFSMGVCLWEMLTGRSLFRRAGGTGVAQILSQEPIVPPGRIAVGLPAALDAACMKALATKAEDRYGDAAELRRELLKAARELPLDGPADEALARLMRGLFETERAKKEAMVLEAKGAPEAMGAPEAPTPLEPNLQPRSRLPYLVSAVLALALVAVGTLALWPKPQVPAPALVVIPPHVPTPEPVVAAPMAPEPTLPPPAPAPAPVELPSHVKVQVQTVPPGAEVRINQRLMGRTPVELQLDRDSKPLKLSVRRAGSEPVEQQLVPDRDQRVLLQLARHKGPLGAADPLQQKW
jgi:serine/threonine-protein kinase